MRSYLNSLADRFTGVSSGAALMVTMIFYRSLFQPASAFYYIVSRQRWRFNCMIISLHRWWWQFSAVGIRYQCAVCLYWTIKFINDMVRSIFSLDDGFIKWIDWNIYCYHVIHSVSVWRVDHGLNLLQLGDEEHYGTKSGRTKFILLLLTNHNYYVALVD